jgi:hypothetical protein
MVDASVSGIRNTAMNEATAKDSAILMISQVSGSSSSKKKKERTGGIGGRRSGGGRIMKMEE